VHGKRPKAAWLRPSSLRAFDIRFPDASYTFDSAALPAAVDVLLSAPIDFRRIASPSQILKTAGTHL
jgi:hypothetical protein